MPPKKQGSSKKPPQAKAPTLIDGLTKEELTKEQMQKHVVHLREELDSVRKNRNHFQLERDMAHAFMEARKRELEEARAKLMNLDKEIEEDEKNHQEEIKVFKQKMKHLLCEHQNTVCELKADTNVSAEAMHPEQQQLQSELSERMNDISAFIFAENLDIGKDLELEHERKMAETTADWEEQLQETKAKYENQMEELLQEMENKRKKEIRERDDQLNNHVINLKNDQSEAIAKISALMQEQVLDESLEDKLQEMNNKLKAADEKLLNLKQDNKRLSESLSNTNEEISATKKMIDASSANYLEVSLEAVRMKDLNKLKHKHEILEQNFKKLQQERDELKGRLTQSIQREQQRSSQNVEELEERLKAMEDILEKTQALIDSVLSNPMVDQAALEEVISQVENRMSSSKNSIEDLQHKRNLISKARRDLLLYHKDMLRALGVS